MIKRGTLSVLYTAIPYTIYHIPYIPYKKYISVDYIPRAAVFLSGSTANVMGRNGSKLQCGRWDNVPGAIPLSNIVHIAAYTCIDACIQLEYMAKCPGRTLAIASIPVFYRLRTSECHVNFTQKATHTTRHDTTDCKLDWKILHKCLRIIKTLTCAQFPIPNDPTPSPL